MNEPILVTGGTGTIGRRVVTLLHGAGRDVRVLSRRGGTDAPGMQHVVGDTRQGTGLDDAFADAPTVVHLAGGPKGDDVGARHVVKAAQRAGTSHLLLISVIGAGDVPIGYVRAKGEAERIVRESGVPFTILRAAQLHSLLLPVASKLSSLRLAPRDVRLEPVDGEAVAARLAELALGAPSGHVADLAGPEVLTFADLVAQYNAHHGLTRRVMRMPVPGALGRAYRGGANLASARASAPVDRVGATWRQFLEEADRVTAARPTAARQDEAASGRVA